MVTRQWKAVVQIGGTVAASLPSSARKATQELERLTTAQRIDSREARKLGGELKTLRKGTQEYKTALAQQASVKTRTAERSVRIRELGERAQTSGGLLGRFGGVLGRLGPYGAAAAAGVGLAVGAVTALVKITNKYADESRSLSRTAIALDADPELLYRTAAALRTVTGDPESAKAQAAGLASAGQQIRQMRKFGDPGFGEVGFGLDRAGVSIKAAQSGNYGLIVDDLRRSLAKGISVDQIVSGLRRVPGYTEEAIQSLLLLATDADAATRALERSNQVEPPSEEQIRQNRRWDAAMAGVKDISRETGRSFTSELTPSLTRVAKHMGGLKPLAASVGTAMGRLVSEQVAGFERLALTGEYLSASMAVAGAGIRTTWHKVREGVTGVIDGILAKLEKLVGGLASVAETVKKATGGAVDFTGAADRGLASIRELRAGVQESNADATAGLNAARQDLRRANVRLSTVWQADRALRSGRQPAQPPVATPELEAGLPPVQVATPEPAIAPPAQRPAPVATPEPAIAPPAQRPAPVATPEPAIAPPAQRPAPVATPEPAIAPPAQRPAPVATPEPAIAPPAQRPAPVATPEPAIAPPAQRPAPVATPEPAIAPPAQRPAPVATPEPAIAPPAQRPAPVATPEPAIAPPAQRPAPVATPEPAIAPARAPEMTQRGFGGLTAEAIGRAVATALRQASPGNPIEQQNTYVIDGSADPTAMLIAAEESSLRMIRQLA